MLNWLAPAGAPNSVEEMLLGYGLMILVVAGYILSLAIRRHRLLRQVDQLENLDDSPS